MLLSLYSFGPMPFNQPCISLIIFLHQYLIINHHFKFFMIKVLLTLLYGSLDVPFFVLTTKTNSNFALLNAFIWGPVLITKVTCAFTVRQAGCISPVMLFSMINSFLFMYPLFLCLLLCLLLILILLQILFLFHLLVLTSLPLLLLVSILFLLLHHHCPNLLSLPLLLLKLLLSYLLPILPFKHLFLSLLRSLIILYRTIYIINQFYKSQLNLLWI